MTRRKLPSRGHSHLCSRFVLVKPPLLCSAITPTFLLFGGFASYPGSNGVVPWAQDIGNRFLCFLLREVSQA
jgi:hypothetical protein